MCWINCSRKNKFLEISFFWYNFSLTLLRNPDGEPFSSISFKPCLHRPLSPRFERRETKYVERGVRSWERAFESDRLKAEPSAAGGAAMQSKIRARREVTGGKRRISSYLHSEKLQADPSFQAASKALNIGEYFNSFFLSSKVSWPDRSRFDLSLTETFIDVTILYSESAWKNSSPKGKIGYWHVQDLIFSPRHCTYSNWRRLCLLWFKRNLSANMGATTPSPPFFSPFVYR